MCPNPRSHFVVVTALKDSVRLTLLLQTAVPAIKTGEARKIATFYHHYIFYHPPATFSQHELGALKYFMQFQDVETKLGFSVHATGKLNRLQLFSFPINDRYNTVEGVTLLPFIKGMLKLTDYIEFLIWQNEETFNL